MPINDKRPAKKNYNPKAKGLNQIDYSLAKFMLESFSSLENDI